MAKTLSLVGITVVSMMILWGSVAFAAQGQITEVNPSGIGKAINAGGRVGDALKNTPASGLDKSLEGSIIP